METKTSRRTLGLLAAALLLALTPGTALAQGLPSDSVYLILFETRESPPVHAAPGNDLAPFPPLPGAFIHKGGILTRIAQATLQGNAEAAGGGLLGDWTEVEVQGQSRINWSPTSPTFLQGTLSGVFHAETVAGTQEPGKLSGQMNLSTLFSSGFGTVAGNWTTLGRNRVGGSFQGAVFAAVELAPGTFVYILGVNPDGSFITAPAQVDKFGNGIARFDLFLFVTPTP